MALVPCPQCRADISNMAVICPGCGFSFNNLRYGRGSWGVLRNLFLMPFYGLLYWGIVTGVTHYLDGPYPKAKKELYVQGPGKSEILIDEKLSVSENHLGKIAFQLNRSSNVKLELGVLGDDKPLVGKPTAGEEGDSLQIGGVYFKKGPPVMVYLLDEESYQKLMDSQSWATVLEDENFTKDKTTGFSAQDQLKPGRYHFLFYSASSKGSSSPKSIVSLKVTAEDF